MSALKEIGFSRNINANTFGRNRFAIKPDQTAKPETARQIDHTKKALIQQFFDNWKTIIGVNTATSPAAIHQTRFRNITADILRNIGNLGGKVDDYAAQMKKFVDVDPIISRSGNSYSGYTFYVYEESDRSRVSDDPDNLKAYAAETKKKNLAILNQLIDETANSAKNVRK